jgi:hypothetical protein
MLAGDEIERVYREVIMPAKLALDLTYVRDQSLLGDLLVPVRTAAILDPGSDDPAVSRRSAAGTRPARATRH